MLKQPLVSIVVITYNSSEFVLETLNSAISQNYPNIEIIISDDCSTDNTIDVIRSWMVNHEGERPIRLIEAEKNTGVTDNCNRGFREARGEWIKGIAGDDILAPTAIESYMGFVAEHPNVRHLRACAVHFSGNFADADLGKKDRISQYMYQEKMTAIDQFKVITKTFFGSGPTYFINADAWREVGGFDSRFPMQDDYPLFIKMIGKGYKMMYLDEVTVYKRVVPTSIQFDTIAGAIFPKNKVRMIVDWKYQYKMEVLSPIWRLFLRYSLWIQHMIIKQGNTFSSRKCKVLYSVYKITDPFVWCDRWLAHKNKLYLAR